MRHNAAVALVVWLMAAQPQAGNARVSELLERVVKRNPDAHKIWNITHKHNTYDASKVQETCISELQRNRQLLPVYLLNITFNSTQTFLEHYIINVEFKHYDGNELKYARKLHGDRIDITADMKEYSKISKQVLKYEGIQNDKELICVTSSFCGCVQSSYYQTFDVELQEFMLQTDHLWSFIVFGSYVDPFFRVTIFFLGLLLNCVMLYIFYKERVVRLESNIMIFNQIISNFLMLLLHIPADYVDSYHIYDYYKQDSLRAIAGIQMLVVSANTLTVFMLNVQRYFDVRRALGQNEQGCKLTPRTRCISYLTVLWTWCLLISAVSCSVSPPHGHVINTLVFFLVYLFLFSIVLGVLNSLTARKLQRSVEEGNNVSGLKNVTRSGVVLSLTLAFYVTHLPTFIFIMYDQLSSWIFFDFYTSPVTRVLVFSFHVLYLLYPCVNVLVLHKSSSTYRCFLNFYLFKCWYNPQQRQYVTMSIESRQ